MGKFKPAKGKAKSASPRSGVGCLILMISGMALALIGVYLVLSSS
ncbi:MAG: hypothetical protein ACRD96_22405 [Bryobacteraceae bacterium]